MKDVKTSLLERTSVRRYSYDQIAPEIMDFIYKAIENTPTSYNGQQFSVIDITDKELKEELYAITRQKQIKTCSHFLVFCSDYNKIALLAREKGLEMPRITDTMDGVVIGIVDASLAMMSAIVAAQSAGLGSNCIGYLRTADPMKVAELLQLPKGVFIVCGLALGYPTEQPDLKPKKPASVVFHKDKYNQDISEIIKEMTEYDSVVKHYNQTRAGNKTDHDWVSHILDYYREADSYRILDYLKSQGYNIDH